MHAVCKLTLKSHLGCDNIRKSHLGGDNIQEESRSPGPRLYITTSSPPKLAHAPLPCALRVCAMQQGVLCQASPLYWACINPLLTVLAHVPYSHKAGQGWSPDSVTLPAVVTNG